MFVFFFTKQTMPLNQFLLLHTAFALPRVNFAAHIYKPEIWGVTKERHGWQLTPWLQHLMLKTREGQNTPYNAVICRVYSHPCFLLYSAEFVCVFVILLAIRIGISVSPETTSFPAETRSRVSARRVSEWQVSSPAKESATLLQRLGAAMKQRLKSLAPRS